MRDTEFFKRISSHAHSPVYQTQQHLHTPKHYSRAIQVVISVNVWKLVCFVRAVIFIHLALATIPSINKMSTIVNHSEDIPMNQYSRRAL